MQKYYHADIYKLVYEEEFFATKTSMVEYLKDNWEEYAFPIGDEIRLVSVTEDEDSPHITITYETMDYNSDSDEEPTWKSETHGVEFQRVQITHLVSEIS
jgi:hypothetical protein